MKAIFHRRLRNTGIEVLLCLSLTAFPTLAMAQAGRLDPSFGKNGIFSDSFGNNNGSNFATVVALQSDGKIVVGGEIGNLGGIIRLNTNGTLDSSFGSGGLVTMKFRVLSNVVTGLAIQPDGKIVISGTGVPGGGDLERLNPNGTLDTSFGSGGRVFTFPQNPGPLVLQPDGKIVLDLGSQMRRFEPNGQLDTTFGNNGTAPLLVPTGLATRAFVLDASGRFLVSALDRYTSDGSLDTSFGTFGQVAVLAPGATAVQLDARILTAGTITTKLTLSGATSGFGLDRVNTDGTADLLFGTRGAVATVFPGAPQATANAVAVQSNTAILAAGEAGNSTTSSFALARYLSSGQLDPSFGSGGRVMTSFGNVLASISAMVIQTDGNIVVVGSAGNSSWEVARYLGQ